MSLGQCLGLSQEGGKTCVARVWPHLPQRWLPETWRLVAGTGRRDQDSQGQGPSLSAPCLVRSSAGERDDRGMWWGWGPRGSAPREKGGLPSGGRGKGRQPWGLSSPLSGPSCQNEEPPAISALHPPLGGLPAGPAKMKLKAAGAGLVGGGASHITDGCHGDQIVTDSAGWEGGGGGVGMSRAAPQAQPDLWGHG